MKVLEFKNVTKSYQDGNNEIELSIEDKEEIETSNESIFEENFDKFMKGKYDILIPDWLGIFKEED